jgi:hypothetical protein
MFLNSRTDSLSVQQTDSRTGMGLNRVQVNGMFQNLTETYQKHRWPKIWTNVCFFSLSNPNKIPHLSLPGGKIRWKKAAFTSCLPRMRILFFVSPAVCDSSTEHAREHLNQSLTQEKVKDWHDSCCFCWLTSQAFTLTLATLCNHWADVFKGI